MRILFIGCTKSSEILLQKLININAEVVAVITKSKSSFNSDFVDLGILCKEEGIHYKYVDNINNNENIEFICNHNPDIIYCFGWSQLLKKDIISIPPKGVIGFHPAKLPLNRGRHPLIWALALGLDETASTFFRIDEEADTGDILEQEIISIEYEDNATTLYNKVMNCAGKQIERLTKKLELDQAISIKQEISKPNIWRKRGFEDGKIDWRMSSLSIYNLVRALTKPYPGAHFLHNGSIVKVWKAKEVITSDYKNIEPGKIIDIYSKESFLIKVGDNLINIQKCSDVILSKGEYLL